MRLAGLFTVSAALIFSGAALAQDWVEFTSREDKFFINFPAPPAVEDYDYHAEDDQLPRDQYPVTARRYTAYRGDSRYSLIAVDYSQVLHVTTLKGATAWAAQLYRRMGQVTYDMYAHLDRIDGHQLQITKPDGRRLFVGIHFHYQGRKLYIMESEVPAGTPPPAAFQVSLQVLDDEGNPIRYNVDDDGNLHLPQRGGGGQ